MNQQSLKELQEIWYKKLKDEGFDDIEHSSPTIIYPQYLADNAPNRISDTEAHVFSQYAETLKETDPRAYRIIQLYLEGKSQRAIAKVITEEFSRISQVRCFQLLRKYRNKAGANY